MPANMKAFQVAQRERDGEVLPFKLEWDDHDGVTHAEEFSGDPANIAPITLMQLPNIVETSNLAPVLAILRQALGKAEFRRFEDFCADPDHLVDATKIVECMVYFVEEGVGRPTQPSSS